jgi:hypothetical protein
MDRRSDDSDDEGGATAGNGWDTTTAGCGDSPTLPRLYSSKPLV